MTRDWPAATMKGQCANCATQVVALPSLYSNPISCHQCLYDQWQRFPDPYVQMQIMSLCLACVPAAQASGYGWSCTGYCSNADYIQNVDQAADCMRCVTSNPRDISTCEGCMTDATDMLGRQMCFTCIIGGLDNFGCVQCATIKDITDRTQCFICLTTGKSGSYCAFGGLAPPPKSSPPPPPPLVIPILS